MNIEQIILIVSLLLMLSLGYWYWVQRDKLLAKLKQLDLRAI